MMLPYTLVKREGQLKTAQIDAHNVEHMELPYSIISVNWACNHVDGSAFSTKNNCPKTGGSETTAAKLPKAAV